MDQLFDLIADHQWVAVAALVVGFLVRAIKSDTRLPITLPPRVRPWLALGLGAVSGVLEHVVTGVSWRDALLGGLASALAAMAGHDVLVEGVRRGREVRMPGMMKAAPPEGRVHMRIPPASIVLLALLLPSCAFLQDANDARIELCDLLGEEQEQAIGAYAEREGIPFAEAFALFKATCLIRAQQVGGDALGAMPTEKAGACPSE